VDASAEPAGYVVVSDAGERIHFLDWGGDGSPGVLLVHGLSSSAWTWAPVARRLAAERRTAAMDLRGHGLSDAPTGTYPAERFVEDVVAAAEGSGTLAGGGVVLAGHGFGGIVAAWAAASIGDRCSRLVLVDGGWEDVAATSGMDPDEFLRGLDEPPEVLRSMAAWLADREAFDPATWDADQERAARVAVVETPAGRLVSATRPHALRACVEAMFTYRPSEVLAAVRAPIVGLAATSSDPVAGVPPFELTRLAAVGHNLMRYRRDEVAAAILGR
jgi:pimeloyl-ACP methyl ester carboxylesterase